jgi:3-deoxy-D-arabino-heptulosonate 7-phosphate (DAHP) synthase
MTKIGLTDGTVFSMILKDWIAYAAWHGARVVASPPHPDMQKEYSALTMSIEFTDGDEKPEPVVKDAVYAASHIVAAIGDGRIVSVEKLPVEGDEEAKYIVTIKKEVNAEKTTEPLS